MFVGVVLFAMCWVLWRAGSPQASYADPFRRSGQQVGPLDSAVALVEPATSSSSWAPERCDFERCERPVSAPELGVPERYSSDLWATEHFGYELEGRRSLPRSMPFVGKAVDNARRARFSRDLHRDGEMVLSEISRSVRAGRTIAGAVRAASWEPLLGAHATQLLRQRLDVGRSVGEALEVASSTLVGSADSRCVPVVRALNGVALADRLGGTAGDAIDRYLDGLRITIENRREAWVLSTQARLSAWVVSSLPLLAVFILALTDPDSLTELVSERWGRFVVGAGVVAELLGLVWMRHLIRTTLVESFDPGGTSTRGEFIQTGGAA